MNVEEIIENLRYNKGVFPKESIIEARKNKEEVSKRLIEELQEVTNNIEKYVEGDNYFLHIYAMYLLAEFKNKEAFPYIVNLIKLEMVDVYNFIGEIGTEGLAKILVSTYNGDVNSLYEIAFNEGCNEFVRQEVMYGIRILIRLGLVDKKEFEDKMEHFIENMTDSDSDLVISEIIDYIKEEKNYEKIPLVRELYDNGMVTKMFSGDYDDFIDNIYGKEKEELDDVFVEDVIKELENSACFNDEEDDYEDDEEKDEIPLEEKLKEAVKAFRKEDEEKYATLDKVGRNDPCPCGSGKKYKKCCMDKEDPKRVLTPADMYIQKSLKKYPEEKIKEMYEPERIEIDKKLYLALKHKQIPLWIERNHQEEYRRNMEAINTAFELIKEKVKKENIKSIEEYNEKIAIHYTVKQIIEGYIKILTSIGASGDDLVTKQVEFLADIYENYDIEPSIDYIVNDYKEVECYDEAEEFLKLLIDKIPALNKMLTLKFIDFKLEDEDLYDNSKVYRLIEQYVEKNGKDTDIIVRIIKAYYDYDETEKEHYEIYKKMWSEVKELIKIKKIKTEEEYNDIPHNVRYGQVVNILEVFFKEADLEYEKEREIFLNEARDIIKLGQDTKDNVILSLTEILYEKGNIEEALSMADEYIKENTKNGFALVIKANIYRYSDNKDIKKAISILEEGLKIEDIEEKIVMYSCLATMYDQTGDNKKAKEYQELIVAEDELPF